jgi:serine/threonine-protein kinase
MATVYLGRMRSPAGFARTVAIKRMHPHFAEDPTFVAMFFDEARLAMQLHHPNIVPTFDVVSADGELLLVMEYVHGESLSGLLRAAKESGSRVPPPIASAVLCGVLEGLHAAHEARGEGGSHLGIVHRDVSPQNIVVGADGMPRILDFGVAKAAGRVQATVEGQIKGKLGYMAPEQLSGFEVDRRADIFAAAVVLWETLTGERAFGGDAPPDVIRAVLTRDLPPPSSIVPDLGRSQDDVVMRGLTREKTSRFPGAREMAAALERAVPPAPARAVSEWVAIHAADALARRAAVIASFESATASPALLTGVEAPTEAAVTALDTSIVAMGSDVRRLPARRWAWAALVAIAVGVPLAVWGRPAGRSPSPPAAASARPEASNPTSEVSAPPGPSRDDSANGTEAASPSSSSIASSLAPAPSPIVPPRSVNPAPRPRAPALHAAAVDCSDPFVIVGGIRVPREECFRKHP